MASFLGSALVELGLISEQQLEKALNLQQQTNPLLGELAIEQGWLTAEQVEDINIVQRIVNQRFGDIAQEEKLLTDKQIQQLLDLQQRRRQRLGDILVREGFIERHELAKALKKVTSENEKALLWSHLSKTQLCALRSIESLFKRIFKSQCKHTEIVDAQQCLKQYKQLMSLSIIEEKHPHRPFMQLSIACNREMLFEMTANFTGLSIEECNEELARDSLGELLNMAAGYIISDPDTPKANLKPSPAIQARSMADICPEKTGQLIAINFESNWGTSATLIALESQ